MCVPDCSASHSNRQRLWTHVDHVQPVRSFYQRRTSENVLSSSYDIVLKEWEVRVIQS